MGKGNWENVRKEKVSDEKEKLFSIAACGRHVSTAVSFSIGSIENGDQSKTIAAGTTEKVMVAEGATPTFTFVPDTETAESALNMQLQRLQLMECRQESKILIHLKKLQKRVIVLQ